MVGAAPLHGYGSNDATGRRPRVLLGTITILDSASVPTGQWHLLSLKRCGCAGRGAGGEVPGGGWEEAAGWLQLSTMQEESSGGGKDNPNREIMGVPRLKKQKGCIRLLLKRRCVCTLPHAGLKPIRPSFTTGFRYCYGSSGPVN